MSLQIVKPITITDAMLISTNVAEADYGTWSGATTYDVGDRVIVLSSHKVYESLQDGNLNKTPASEPTWWIEVSATNRWKVFDTSNQSQAVADPNSNGESITYTLKPGQGVSAVGVLNITNGAEVTVVMTDPGYGEVYRSTVNLGLIPEDTGWWAWFFGARTAYRPQAIFTDLPVEYPLAEITITITSVTDGLAVGVVILGRVNEFSLGIRYGARVGIQDYSRKEVNEFGDTVLVQRAFAKRANIDMLLTKEETDSFNTFLASVRAVPCLWIGSTDYDATIIFGYYKNYDILISYPTYSDASLELEGLT